MGRRLRHLFEMPYYGLEVTRVTIVSLNINLPPPVVVDRDATECNRLADDIYTACLCRS